MIKTGVPTPRGEPKPQKVAGDREVAFPGDHSITEKVLERQAPKKGSK